MSKATPLSQLPNFQQQPSLPPGQQQQTAPPPFVNDQHRQLVIQAQAATQNYSVPQPSSEQHMGGPPDDDPTIRETLQYINSGSHVVVAPGAVLQQQPQPLPLPMPPSPPYVFPGGSAKPQDAAAHLLSSAGPDDLRIALLGVLAYLAIAAAPVPELVGRYLVSLSHVPYSEVLIRAALMGVVLFVGRRLLALSGL